VVKKSWPSAAPSGEATTLSGIMAPYATLNKGQPKAARQSEGQENPMILDSQRAKLGPYRNSVEKFFLSNTGAPSRRLTPRMQGASLPS
jgi:hypothetical protein